MLKLYTHVLANITALRKNMEGVTAIEYGLIAGAIAVAIIAVLLALGGDINNLFTKTSGALQQAGTTGGSGGSSSGG
ncbi:MAG: Flp family type IVb pilin [Pseudomonadota bacterium]